MKDISIIAKIAPDTYEGRHAYVYLHGRDAIPGYRLLSTKTIDLNGKTTIYPSRFAVVDQYYTIFPNPAYAKQVRLRLCEPVNAVIHIYGLKGDEVPPKVKAGEAGMVEVTLPENVTSGTYLLRVAERGKSR